MERLFVQVAPWQGKKLTAMAISSRDYMAHREVIRGNRRTEQRLRVVYKPAGFDPRNNTVAGGDSWRADGSGQRS